MIRLVYIIVVNILERWSGMTGIAGIYRRINVDILRLLFSGGSGVGAVNLELRGNFYVVAYFRETQQD